MKRITILLSIFVACVFQTLAQQETLHFLDGESYDFGEFDRNRHEVIHSFKFINMSPDSVKLKKVTASCGCTVPTWTKEKIAPGDTAQLSVGYHPGNGYGGFRKSVGVETDNGFKKQLYIKGKIVPVPAPNPEGNLMKFNVGPMIMSQGFINFGTVERKKKYMKSMKVFNNSYSEIKLDYDSIKLPKGVIATIEPETIPKKSYGWLIVTFQPKFVGELGYYTTQIPLKFKDNSYNQKYYVSLSATIKQNKKKITSKSLVNLPILVTERDVFDFGSCYSGEVVEAQFLIRNKGITSLKINEIKPNCDCVTHELVAKEILKNDVHILKVFFDTKGKEGNEYKEVVLYTNDPITPTKILKIKGTVRKRN